jgi:hypothetical protein
MPSWLIGVVTGALYVIGVLLTFGNVLKTEIRQRGADADR